MIPLSIFSNFSIDLSKKSFWINRGDRHHCGFDIYLEKGSKVLSFSPGRVIKTGVFTSSDLLYYWNKTFYVDVKLENGLFCRYAELEKLFVSVGDKLEFGDTVGLVGCVLNKDKIDSNSPMYIQKLRDEGNFSMLHFELYKNTPVDVKDKCYLGGNWFCEKKPEGLIDPTSFLKVIFTKI